MLNNKLIMCLNLPQMTEKNLNKSKLEIAYIILNI